MEGLKGGKGEGSEGTGEGQLGEKGRFLPYLAK